MYAYLPEFLHLVLLCIPLYIVLCIYLGMELLSHLAILFILLRNSYW